MELSIVHEFLVLAETLSYHDAAQKTGVSVPVLTRHIQKLESELGTPLFTRTTRRVILNKMGQLFLPYAQMLAHTDKEFSEILTQHKEQSENRLRIGTMSIANRYGITKDIAAFREQHPECIVDVIEEDSEQLMLMLDAKECDLIFARDDGIMENKFHCIPYVTDYLCVLTHVNHPLAHRKSVRLEELRDENFLTFPVDTYMYNRCVRLCTSAGYDPNIVFSIFGEKNLMQLIEAGLGISLLLNKPATYHNNPNIAIIDLEPEVTSRINIMYSKTAAPPGLACAFLEYILSQRSSQA